MPELEPDVPHHDFVEQEQELKINTELTRAVHALTTDIHTRLVGRP